MKIVTSEVMRAIDKKTIDGGFVEGKVLMERAGYGAAEAIIEFAEGLHVNHCRRFLVICGKGNNGGDGYVIAKALFEQGLEAHILGVSGREDLQGDAAFHAGLIPEGVPYTVIQERLPLQAGDIIVDCLLGTGLSSDVKEPYQSIIEQINASSLPVIAVDIASGLNGSSGEVQGVAVLADLTVTIGLPKTGLFNNSGPAHSGRLRCIDIGFPAEIIDSFSDQGRAVSRTDLSRFFQRRPHSSHKYKCGNVLIIGGSRCYGGAPLLAARAAARSGAGMVSVLYPQSLTPSGPDSLIKIPLSDDEGCFAAVCAEEVLPYMDKPDTIAIGPGMIGTESEKALIKTVFESDKNIVADAGALLHLAGDGSLLDRQGLTVLTPHEGELQRLLKGMGLKSAAEIAQTYQCYVLLKGQFSRLYCPSGEVVINCTGSSALATAGSGDVLSGVIASLVSSSDDFQAAVEAAVGLHGLCGELSHSGLRGSIADDFIEMIPDVLRFLSPFN